MSDWKPGDVAMVTATPFAKPERTAVAWMGVDHCWHFPDGSGVHSSRDELITNVRPLVVIDPEDREAVERLREIASRLADWVDYDADASAYTDAMQAALREFANPKPPRPDEPTNLYAVVRDDGGDEWCHIGGQVWRSLTSTGQFMVEKHWHDSDSPLAESAVEVISEGRP